MGQKDWDEDFKWYRCIYKEPLKVEYSSLEEYGRAFQFTLEEIDLDDNKKS